MSEKSGLPKNWGPVEERPITDAWSKVDLFPVKLTSKKKIYSIDTPPPYVNAPIHIAQAVTYCYMDFFARYKRMKGFDVIFPLGLDRNGLPIELATEKKFKTSPFKVGREKFIELCEQLINEGSVATAEIFSQLGISFTSYKEGDHPGAIYKTDSPEYRSLTQSTFIDLFKKGIAYEDTRVNNWDPKLRTTIADSEIEYVELPSTFNDIAWKVKETGEEIVIATTRPELIGTCSAVIYNPKDERYKHLKGKHAIIPLYNREVEIMPHPFADINKGTGIVMMCAGGDLTDIQFVREMKLDPIIAVGKDGTLNEKAGFLEGLKVRDAREKIIEKFKSEGLLKKQEKIVHKTPISDRSKAEVEFIEMPEFYLKQLDFRDEIKNVSKKINFFPDSAREILNRWLDMIAIDWPISRRRFYATPIPLWYDKELNLTALPTPGEYYIPWKNPPPKNAVVFINGKESKKQVKDFPEANWEGETRVFDTWMDSSISELFILKYKSNPDFFKKSFPASLRPQGKEIVRTWLYYTILRGYLETGNACFKDTWVHQHLTDDKGRKMAKSLGNVIDPRDLMKEFGAEAIRFWGATEGNLAKQDLKVSREKIMAERKTLTKILNIGKFVMQFDKPKSSPKLTAIDQLFIDYIEDLTAKTDSAYDAYDFFTPSTELRKFVWDIFASHYIELVKARAYNEEGLFSDTESSSAKYTLYFLLDRLLHLLYPIVPQLSFVIARELGVNILKADFPSAKIGKSDLSLIDKLVEFNSFVWKKKKDEGISLRNPIEGVNIPIELVGFEKDLRSTHKI